VLEASRPGWWCGGGDLSRRYCCWTASGSGSVRLPVVPGPCVPLHYWSVCMQQLAARTAWQEAADGWPVAAAADCHAVAGQGRSRPWCAGRCCRWNPAAVLPDHHALWKHGEHEKPASDTVMSQQLSIIAVDQLDHGAARPAVLTFVTHMPWVCLLTRRAGVPGMAAKGAWHCVWDHGVRGSELLVLSSVGDPRG